MAAGIVSASILILVIYFRKRWIYWQHLGGTTACK